MGEGVVALVLLHQEGMVQYPIYFISHLLKEAKARYFTLEKLALALALTTSRLRPYFLSYPLIVLTNSTLGCVLTNPKASERMIKWMMELSEYDIQYHL